MPTVAQRGLIHDAQGNKSSTTALGHTSTFQYDAAGRMTSSTDADGRQRTFTYNDAGQLLTETWFDAQGTQTEQLVYTYDGDGNMLSASNSNGTYSYVYDGTGRLIQVTEPTGVTLNFAYDGAGNRTLVTDSLGGSTRSVYDTANRLVSQWVSQNGTLVAHVGQTYDWAGRLLGLQATLQPRGRPAKMVEGPNTAVFEGLEAKEGKHVLKSSLLK